MMAILDSIKDSNTGKIKMPILISLVGAGGLLLYLVMKGGSGSSTTAATNSGASTAPDLTGLTAAVQAMISGNSVASGGGGSDTGASVDPPASYTGSDTTGSANTTGGYTGGGSGTIPVDPTGSGSVSTVPSVTPQVTQQPSVAQSPGSSGSAGGGGSGTGQVLQPIAKSTTVYGGVTAAATAASVAATSILNSPSLTAQTSPSALDLKIAAVAVAHPGATQSAILATAKKDLATSTGATVKANTSALSKAITAVNTTVMTSGATKGTATAKTQVVPATTATTGTSGGGTWNAPVTVPHAAQKL